MTIRCQEGHEVDPTSGVCEEGHPPAQVQGAQAMQAEPVSLPCVWDQCAFATPAVAPTEVNIASMMRYLEGHVEAAHQPKQRVGQQASNRLMEKLPRPEAMLDMSDTQWREFMREWSRYKRSTGISGQLMLDQLHGCCSAPLRLDMASEVGDELDGMQEETLLQTMKRMAVRETNPMVHRNRLRGLVQGETERFRNYVARLKEVAIDCLYNVKCTDMAHAEDREVSYREEMVRDQAIYGIYDREIQSKILAKGSRLLGLEAVVVQAEAEEQAKITQNKLGEAPAEVNKVSAFKQGKNEELQKKADLNIPCHFCGQKGHGKFPAREVRQKSCPAWNKACDRCSKIGHLSPVCKLKEGQKGEKEKVTANSVMTKKAMFSRVAAIQGIHKCKKKLKLDHVEWSKEFGWRKTAPYTMPKLAMDITVLKEEQQLLYSMADMQEQKVGKVMGWMSTPDTGAQVVLSGVALLSRLNIGRRQLIPVSQEVEAANSYGINILGAVLISASVSGDNSGRYTQQLCYVSEQVHGLFLSLSACKDLGIVSQDFPLPAPVLPPQPTNPEDKQQKAAVAACGTPRGQGQETAQLAECGCPIRTAPPSPPTECPPGLSTQQQLEDWVLNSYAASAFNVCEHQVLPSMQGEAMNIVMNKSARPVANHIPTPVPIHWQEEVKRGLERDVEIGVLEKVPVNTPTEWLHRMVLAPKHDGSPRRTIDLQPLNEESFRQTHYTPSPWQCAAAVPRDTFKTKLDAWNAFHSVELTPESQKLTSFATMWGTYRYRKAPMGYLATGDAYTHRYDNIVKEIKHISKCVDDVCLWGETLEETFIRTCQYLTHCTQNGIIFNPEKFVMGRESVEFVGFELTKEGIKPMEETLQSIRDFPTPTDITGVRSFFGLIQQVSYAFTLTKPMAPFRELLKSSSRFYWDEVLQEMFDKAKEVIIKEIEKGVKTFDKKKPTCIATDWSKEGLGFFLLQKHCSCEVLSPVCCKTGWQLVMAGSRFTKEAESRYSPVEGEALAVTYGLHKCRYYVLGCQNLLIATDHQPLLKIFSDRKLDDIENPRLLRLKEKSLIYKFKIVHVPGRKHAGPDALSRHPMEGRTVQLAALRVRDSEEMLECAVGAPVAALAASMVRAVTLDRVRQATVRDTILQQVMDMVVEGVIDNKEAWEGDTKEFYKHRNNLSVISGVLMYNKRVVIPRVLRAEVLECLHAASQGVQGMKARAEDTVFWPGISGAIVDKRNRCRTCDTIAPSQAAEPPITAPPPSYPFEQIVVDYFTLDGHTYLAMADRYSGWLSVSYNRGLATCKELTSDMRTWFMTFGAPAELASDGGPSLTAHQFQLFLRNWGVHHRLSSVGFPHSNCRAELAVKSAKRLIRENVGPGGELDCDKFARALLQYRNTKLQGLGVSPAQILFGRELRDFLPFAPGKGGIRKEWQIVAEEREVALARKHVVDMERLEAHTKELGELEIGQSVSVQNQVGSKPGRWDKTGVVVEKGAGPRQYLVRMDGSGRITLRNRRFLRKCSSFADSPYPSVVVPESTPAQSRTQNQSGTQQATPDPITQSLPEHGVMEDSRVEGTVEEQVQPRSTDRADLLESPALQEVTGGMEEETRRYPVRRRKPNVRLNDYVVEVDRVRAMSVRSYAEVLRGSREETVRQEPVREEPDRRPGRRGQEVMMLSGMLEVVLEKLMRMASVEDTGEREI